MKKLPQPKPVQKIELSEKHLKLRVVLLIVAIAVAVAAFVYAVNGFFSAEPGWTTIEVPESSDLNCGKDFTFTYYLGDGQKASTAEKKAITSAYTVASINAYKQFAAEYEAEEMNNVYYLNHHPNTTVEVDPVLYRAFSLLAKYDSRALYLAPVYRMYDNIFYSFSDYASYSNDPYYNEEVKTEIENVLYYVSDPESVRLELYGENQVKLVVSDFYRAYAYENGIEDFIDFYWMKNAFILDYLAEEMSAQGYKNGAITSVEGYTKMLGGVAPFSQPVYSRENLFPYLCARFESKTANSVVNLHRFKIFAGEELYHSYESGEVRTPFIHTDSGLDSACLSLLIGYSESLSCAELLMRMIPVYLADEFVPENALSITGAEVVYEIDRTVFFSESGLTIEVNATNENAIYQKQYLQK